MEFEYDPEKSKINKAKHNIDFEEAKELWKNEENFEIPTKGLDEQRYVVFGKINDKNWTAVITYRGSQIRIISVRRSRRKEVQLHESFRIR